MATAQPHLLDYPIWNALRTGNSNAAYGNSRALFIRRDMGAFAGMPHYGADAWSALHEAASVGEIVVLFAPHVVAVPQGWQVTLEKPLLQMVHQGTLSKPAFNNSIVPLDENHIPAMLALTGLTKPGPFLQRTIDFGNYEGIFENDALVSMAGQRFQPHPYTEISAVCTPPSALGKGYARMLIQSQISKIMAAGRIPFLHVFADNTSAIALYQKLNFEIRKELMVYVLQKKDG